MKLGKRGAVKLIEMPQNAVKESKQRNVVVFETVTKIMTLYVFIYVAN
jgi:hypothetical protein